MSKQQYFAALIGETHVTRLDTLRILCEYVVTLQRDIDALRLENNGLRAQIEAIRERVVTKLYNDSEEAKAGKAIVAELTRPNGG